MQEVAKPSMRSSVPVWMDMLGMVKAGRKNQSRSKVQLYLYQMNVTNQHLSITGLVLAG